jgi:hypothetical protein
MFFYGVIPKTQTEHYKTHETAIQKTTIHDARINKETGKRKKA